MRPSLECLNQNLFLFFDGWGMLGFGIFAFAYSISHLLWMRGSKQLEPVIKVDGLSHSYLHFHFVRMQGPRSTFNCIRCLNGQRAPREDAFRNV